MKWKCGTRYKRGSFNGNSQKGYSKKTGARGLRSIIENILMETMYKVPSEDSLNKVVIDASVVNGESELSIGI